MIETLIPEAQENMKGDPDFLTPFRAGSVSRNANKENMAHGIDKRALLD